MSLNFSTLLSNESVSDKMKGCILESSGSDRSDSVRVRNFPRIKIKIENKF